MGSEQSWNMKNDGTSFQPSEPALCANGCGFFGSAATMNLCSKCYGDMCIKEEQAASAKAAMVKSLNATSSSSTLPLLLQRNQIESLVGTTSSNSSESSSVVCNGGVHGVPAGDGVKSKAANRCGSCKRKVGLTGFKCKCGSTFCGTHRYPENHDCTFDFKGAGREAIEKANPVIKADKVDRF